MALKQLKLMAEVQCWALWNMVESDNIDPSSLPISKILINDLNDWSDRFDEIYKLDAPNFHMSIGFESEEVENEFYNDGWLLHERLKSEMPNVDFWYRDMRYQELLQKRPSS